MAKSLTPNAGGSLTPAQKKSLSAFENYGARADSGGASFMKFTKTGHYLCGAQGDELQYGTIMLANMASLKSGFICWKGGNAVDEKLELVTSENFIDPTELEDHGPYNENAGEGWREQSVIDFVLVEDKSTWTFKTSSGGGIGAIGKMSKAYGSLCKEAGTMDIVPVVCLDGGSYQHKQFGEICFPILHVIGALPLKDTLDDKLKPATVLKKFAKAADAAIAA